MNLKGLEELKGYLCAEILKDWSPSARFHQSPFSFVRFAYDRENRFVSVALQAPL